MILKPPFALSKDTNKEKAVRKDTMRFAKLFGRYVADYPCHFGKILYNYRIQKITGTWDVDYNLADLNEDEFKSDYVLENIILNVTFIGDNTGLPLDIDYSINLPGPSYTYYAANDTYDIALGFGSKLTIEELKNDYRENATDLFFDKEYFDEFIYDSISFTCCRSTVDTRELAEKSEN